MDDVTIEVVIGKLGDTIPAAAERLGVSRQTVYDWLRLGGFPAHHLLRIHDETGIAISRLRSIVRNPREKAA